MPGRPVRGVRLACTAWLLATTALAEPEPPATPYGALLYRDGDAGPAYRPFRPLLPDAARPLLRRLTEPTPNVQANTDPSTYDVLGRRYYVGLTAKF